MLAVPRVRGVAEGGKAVAELQARVLQNQLEQARLSARLLSLQVRRHRGSDSYLMLPFLLSTITTMTITMTISMTMAISSTLGETHPLTTGPAVRTEAPRGSG
jgi:hypothetical protein